MRDAIRQLTNVARWLPVALMVALFLLPSSAQAGSYIVAQCSPGVYTGADDAGFTASTTHYTAARGLLSVGARASRSPTP